MDPITGVGFAASIVQLLQFSIKLAKTAHEIQKRGSSSDVAEASALSGHVSEMSIAVQNSLKDPRITARGSTAEEKQLISVGQKCEEVAAKLQKEVASLTAQKSGSKLEGLKIEKIMGELDGYRNVLETGLLARLSHNYDLQSLATSERFDSLDEASKRIITRLAESQTQLATLMSNETEQTRQHLTSEITRLEKLRIDEQALDYFKKSLFFPEIFARQEHIEREFDEIADSNKWIFGDIATSDSESNIPEEEDDDSAYLGSEPTWDSFSNWLRNGSGTYWISGKAGSGKSTLMNYICNSRLKKELLEEWSGGKHLLCPTYFFWNSGTPLQKSVDGLLRSLLYQIVSECPELAFCTKVYTWTHKRLVECLKTMLLQTQIPLSMCIFVDGLDEFEGRYNSIISVIRELGESQHVKFCVSSRPYSDFERAFNACRNLRLHELTAASIRAYSEVQLSRALHQQNTYSETELFRINALRDKLVEKAEGVFLWIILTIRQLCDGVQDLADLDALEEEINDLHPDIEDLYAQLLTRIKPAYQKDAARFFKLALLDDHFIYDSITCFFFLEREWHPIKRSLVPFDANERSFVAICNVMRTRILSHTQSLLNVSPINSQDLLRGLDINRVTIFHKTLMEFFKSNEKGREFLNQAKLSDTESLLARARALLCLLIWLCEIIKPDNVAYTPNSYLRRYGAFTYISEAETIGDVIQTRLIMESLQPHLSCILPASVKPLPHNPRHWFIVKDVTGMAAMYLMYQFVFQTLDTGIDDRARTRHHERWPSQAWQTREIDHGTFRWSDSANHDRGRSYDRQQLVQHLNWIKPCRVVESLASLPETYLLLCCFNKVTTFCDDYKKMLRISRHLISIGALPMAQMVVQTKDDDISLWEPISPWENWLICLGRCGYWSYQPEILKITQLMIDHGSDVGFRARGNQFDHLVSSGLYGASVAYEIEITAMSILRSRFPNVAEWQGFVRQLEKRAEEPAVKRIHSITRFKRQTPAGTVDECIAQVTHEQSELLWHLSDEIDKESGTGSQKWLATLESASATVTQIFSLQYPSEDFSNLF